MLLCCYVLCVHVCIFVPVGIELREYGYKDNRSTGNWSEIRKVENFSFCSVTSLVYL